MLYLNPYVNVWLIGTILSMIILDKMSEGNDEGSRLIKKDLFVLSIFWPLLWALVIVSLIKEIFTNEKDD
jgi:uncharacterized paraquat-inducible protein A